MNRLEASLERLQRLRSPAELTFAHDGQAIAVVLRPATRQPNQSHESRIWRLEPGGAADQLTHGPGADDLPRYSPADDRLAFASDRAVTGKMGLYVLDNGDPQQWGDIPGTVEDIRWSKDGSAIYVLAADRGLDGGATNGAQRLTWGDEEDPVVTRPSGALRRIFRVDPKDGRTTEVGPENLSVWEFDLLGDDGAVALASADPSERGWYHAEIIRIDFSTRESTVLHRSDWPMQALAADPAGTRVAFLENWSSDRGLVSGPISILDLGSGSVSTFAPGGHENVTTMSWRDDGRLWFAGWSRLGSVHGVTDLNGKTEWLHTEDAVIGPDTFSASITPTPDGNAVAAVREAVGVAPEVVFRQGQSSEWQPVSRFNVEVSADLPGYPQVRAVTWKGPGSLDLEGLVLLPRDRAPGPQPMVVDIHGGPSWASKHAFNPGYALPLAAAGFVVFLPNFRGNVGWGKDFGMLNIGDPGGAEFEDILAGIDWCVAEGIADENRLGVTGASYGGYMTAWAVATTDRFKAAVMVSGIADQLSSHYSCSHDFHNFINGGALTDPRNRQIAVDRSPLTRLDRPTTPTLIIHGEGDRCTPLGQAQEFYAALVERGVATELVVYPREGHGLQEREHQRDAARRTAAWFDRYLRGAS